MTAKSTAMLPFPNETDPDLRLIVLGNPENRRVELFARAVTGRGRGRIEVVSWLDFLQDSNTLASRLAPGAVLRIESPGENFEVERALLMLGSDDMAGDGHTWMSRDEIMRLEFQRGRVLAMRQWYCGWQRALARVEDSLNAVPGCRVMNPPGEIGAMFDKARCHEILRARRVTVPTLLGIPGSSAELRAMMSAHQCRRVFLKPCHSSSASGVVALEVSSGSEQAFSSVELVRERGEVRLFNSLKVRRYSGTREISELIDAVCQERSLAEAWLPKAGFDGLRFDLRVLVVAGSAAHVVVRQSSGPMTNLHLGNQRGDLRRLRERMGETNWQAAMGACEQAAAAFPNSLYIAVDLLVAPSFRRVAVAEVNAFGDLLPNVLHDGRDTYATELEALVESTPRSTAEPQVSTIGL
jgi:glutathione synthase/RimK-type ligase-like ATP-grasp enzyme